MFKLKHKAKSLIACLLCLFLIVSVFSSCRGRSGQKTVSWLLNSAPRNLDPQTARGESELIVIKNCFTGLFEKNDNGEYVSSLVKEYEISDDGLDYTFTLRDDVFWSIYEENRVQKYAPITADDFVFAIERLFSDNPNSDVMAVLKSIKNADKVLKGADISKLGVSARNKKTLKITLSSKNSALLDAFTSYLLFPCNRVFFSSTSGRYGLSYDTMLFNGSFYLKAWGESSMRLEKNVYGAETPKIDAVTLYMPKSTREHISLLKEGSIDAAFLSSAQYSQLDASLLNTQRIDANLCALVFNTNSEIWKNKNLRDAVINATDREVIALGEHLTPANQLIPSSAQIYNRNYREQAGDVLYPSFSPSKAKELYKTALEELSIPEILNAEILIADDTASREAFAPLNQIYQKELPLYFSPQYLSRDTIISRVKSGDFEAAVVSLDITANTPSAILEYFLDSSLSCLIPLDSQEFKDGYLLGLYPVNRGEAAASFAAAEKAVLNSSVVLPLYYENSYFVSLKSSYGYRYDSSGVVLFKNVNVK